tara:strand:- start:199 stop:573 length:375 start_codon:yes stop_codon:yes gene_type:complete
MRLDLSILLINKSLEMLDTTAMLDFQHPDVDIIWNIFPLNLVVWGIFRVPLNMMFFGIYIPWMWTWWLWNLLWESLMALVIVFPIQSVWTTVNIFLVLSSIFILPIPFMLFSVGAQFIFGFAYS